LGTLQRTVARTPTSPREVVILVALALVISYIDRGNLATAGPLLSDELKLSPTQLGTLLSAFYLAYASAMVPSGWLADRYGARVVLTFGMALWSIATLFTGFAGGFGTILALRLLLGLGESGVFPCASKLICSSVDTAHVGIANGVITFGYLIGPAIGTFAGGLLMAHFGWRVTFVLFGTLSLLWLLPWNRVRVEEQTTSRASAQTAETPTFRAILRQRALWGTAIGSFGMNYSFFFILAWLPTYLVKVRGFSMDEMTTVAAPAYALSAVMAVIGGFGIDCWVRRKGSANMVHKGLLGFNCAIALGTMAGMVLLPQGGSIICLYVYQFFGGLAGPSIYAVSQIFAGPGATGRWVGVQNLCTNLAGIVAPALTGVLIDASGSYVPAFLVAGLTNIIGFMGWVLLMPRVAPIRWHGDRGQITADATAGASG
jgi:MFS family permease